MQRVQGQFLVSENSLFERCWQAQFVVWLRTLKLHLLYCFIGFSCSVEVMSCVTNYEYRAFYTSCMAPFRNIQFAVCACGELTSSCYSLSLYITF